MAAPPLSTVAEVEVPHQKAFSAYLRSGDDDGLRGLVIEEKGLTVASDGGFLAAPQVAETVQNVLRTGASLRRLANVVTIESATYEVLVEKNELGAGWADEDTAADTAPGGIDRISIPLHELSAMPKASQRLLDDAAFDVEAWLAERIADTGSVVVFLDGAPRQVAHPPSARGQERFWRIGPARRPFDDPSYRGAVTKARGIGLRPYAPCHLRIDGRTATWIRRGRLDGDTWEGIDIPLGETRERYRLQLERNGTVLHAADVDTARHVIPDVVWDSLKGADPFTLAVCQLSDQFGPGPFAKRTCHVD